MYSYVDGVSAGTTILPRKRRKSRSLSQQQKAKHDVPLEERLKEVLASTSASSGEGYLPADSPSTAKAEELVVNLIKGLHASDKKLIDDVVDTTNLELIKSTVRRLPVQSLLPLLRQLSARIRSKSDVRPYVRWLHIVLSTHLAYLATIPEIVDELCSQHEILEQRMTVFDKVLRLQGRLGLILDQFADKELPQNRLELSNKAAKAVFIEESEPEEEIDMSPTDEQEAPLKDLRWEDIEWSDEEAAPAEKDGSDEDEDEDDDEDEDQDQQSEDGEETSGKGRKLLNGGPMVNGGGEYSDDDDEENEESDEDDEEDSADDIDDTSPSRLKRKRKVDADEDEVDDLMEFS